MLLSKNLLAITLITLTFATTQAQAIGCLSGAAGGAVAGHVAGHHAVIGAITGCAVGHHLAAKKKEEAEANKLIADYTSSSNDPARQAKDAAGIEKLAKKKVAIAVQWTQDNPTVPK